MWQFVVKCIFCSLGIGIAMSSFYPHAILWGFDYYVLKLPFPRVSFIAFCAFIIFSVYPFFFGKRKYLDLTYVLLAVPAILFLLMKIDFTVKLIVGGYDKLAILSQREGIEVFQTSLFFSYPSRLTILLLILGYLVSCCAHLWFVYTRRATQDQE